MLLQWPAMLAIFLVILLVQCWRSKYCDWGCVFQNTFDLNNNDHRCRVYWVCKHVCNFLKTYLDLDTFPWIPWHLAVLRNSVFSSVYCWNCLQTQNQPLPKPIWSGFPQKSRPNKKIEPWPTPIPGGTSFLWPVTPTLTCHLDAKSTHWD